MDRQKDRYIDRQIDRQIDTNVNRRINSWTEKGCGQWHYKFKSSIYEHK